MAINAYLTVTFLCKCKKNNCLKKSNQNLTKLEVDECFSSPCQNGAKCHKLEQSGFSCDCRRGFTGEQYL